MRGAIVGLTLGVLGCAKPYLGVRPDAPPAPPGIAHSTETLAGDIPRFAQAWRPEAGEARGVVVVMHGLRDHGDRYAPFAARLVARGYAVYAFDLRGHGRSAGRRVTIGAFDEYLDDFDGFVASVRAREPGRPLFVFGHSMGGLIVLLWAERHPDVAGVITSAPAIRIDTLPFTAAATFVAGTLLPNAGGLAPDNRGFSSDPAVEADMGRDPFIYQPAGPVHTAVGLVGGIEKMWAAVDRLTAPLLLLHGTGDTLTAPAGSRELFARAASRDKTLRLYEGQAHDLVHEPMHEQITGDVLAWLDAHTGGAETMFPAADTSRSLRGDGAKPTIALSLEGAYRRYGGDLPGRFFGGGLRLRFMLGHRLVWPLGLDAEVLGGEHLLYRVAAHLVGLGYVAANGDTISIAGGVGSTGTGDGHTWEIPVALDGELQLGPVRLLGWGRVAWFTSFDGRALQLGAAVRLGADHHFWSTANAGAGPYLGITWDRQLGQDAIGVVLGLHLWGGS